MNEALISGLLGAVMGGASSMEKSIAEEMAAKQKEEEEKRREERLLSIEERKRASAEAMKAAQEKARMERIASYLGPAGGATPSQSPMEPEGGGITEYQIPTEQRLVRGIEAATAKGDVEGAKLLSDQYKAMKQEERAQAKEVREQEEFARGPKPKEPTGEVATIQFLARQTYTGPVGEDGKPDPVAFARHMKNVSESFIERKTYIRPEREGGGEKPPRAITPKEETAARNSLQRDLARLSEVTDAKGKVTRDPLMWESLNKITSRIIKEDRTKLLDPGLADEARAEVQAAIERARTDIRADLEKKTDAKGEPLSREQIRKNEAILRNQYSLDRYSKENLPKYVNRYLGGGAAEEPKRGGRPWERSWGGME